MNLPPPIQRIISSYLVGNALDFFKLLHAKLDPTHIYSPSISYQFYRRYAGKAAFTGLMRAAQQGQFKHLQVLYQPKSTVAEKRLCLWLAARFDHLVCLSYLTVQWKPSSSVVAVAIEIAISKGHLRTVQWLLNHHSYVNWEPCAKQFCDVALKHKRKRVLQYLRATRLRWYKEAKCRLQRQRLYSSL